MKKQKQFQLIICAVGLALMAGVSGCANQKSFGAAKFTSTPAGAEVINLKDDSMICKTPCYGVFEGKKDKSEYVTIEMKKTGYKEEITSFWVNTRHETRVQAENGAQPINVELEKR